MDSNFEQQMYVRFEIKGIRRLQWTSIAKFGLPVQFEAQIQTTGKDCISNTNCWRALSPKRRPLAQVESKKNDDRSSGHQFPPLPYCI